MYAQVVQYWHEHLLARLRDAVYDRAEWRGYVGRVLGAWCCALGEDEVANRVILLIPSLLPDTIPRDAWCTCHFGEYLLGLDQCSAGHPERKGSHGIRIATHESTPPVFEQCIMCKKPSPLHGMVPWNRLIQRYQGDLLVDETFQHFKTRNQEEFFLTLWGRSYETARIGVSVRAVALDITRFPVRRCLAALDSLDDWETILSEHRLMDARALDETMDVITRPDMDTLRSRTFGYVSGSPASLLVQTHGEIEYRGGYTWLLMRHVNVLLHWVTTSEQPPPITLHVLSANGFLRPDLCLSDDEGARQTAMTIGADWALLYIPSPDSTARLRLSLASVQHPNARFYWRGTIPGFGSLRPPRVQREAYPILPVSPMVRRLAGAFDESAWAAPQTDLSLLDDQEPALAALRDIALVKFRVDGDRMRAVLHERPAYFFAPEHRYMYILVFDKKHMYCIVHRAGARWPLGEHGAHMLDEVIAPGWIIEPLGGANFVRSALADVIRSHSKRDRLESGMRHALSRSGGRTGASHAHSGPWDAIPSSLFSAPACTGFAYCYCRPPPRPTSPSASPKIASRHDDSM